jgi:hypothetical protein
MDISYNAIRSGHDGHGRDHHSAPFPEGGNGDRKASIR